MSICSFPVLACTAVSLVSSLVSPLPSQAAALRYQFVPGQKLRFLIQRDPYFADPKTAFETVNPDAPYRVPNVERLTEKVLSVATDGTATLRVTLTSEPGFEDPDHPQPPLTRMVVVTPNGQVVSVSGPKLGSSPAERDLLRGFPSLTPGLAVRPDGLAVETRTATLPVMQSKSPGHDGILTQTTSAAQADHLVFDCRQGQLVREVSTMTITMTLVMNGRGRRGSDDFGHVVPKVQVVQTLTVEGMME